MLVAVDNCGVGAKVAEEVATRLKTRVGLKRERFAVCSTHTHCGPALSNELDFIFGTPIPADQKARIERYTRELTDSSRKSHSRPWRRARRRAWRGARARQDSLPTDAS